MKTVAILSKPSKPELATIVPDLVGWLRSRDVQVIVDPETSRYAAQQQFLPRCELAAEKPEFAIVLGGDGTLLASARALANAGVPILGVNLGTLGFLTEVSLSDMYPVLESLLAGKFRFDMRSMLNCELHRTGEPVSNYGALNDIVINHGSIARVANFEVRINQAFVSHYKADGIILATPTGSTAYSLAAGGPILSPQVQAWVITPVSPHTLSNRPLVIQDSAEVEIRVVSCSQGAFLTVDGQVGLPLDAGAYVICRKSIHQAKLLRVSQQSFFDVLRTKMKWGEE